MTGSLPRRVGVLGEVRLDGDRERPEGAVLPERDGYIAGVPCWVDTSQPDPDAAADFYGGLFGWEFEDAMPAGAPGRYLIARLRGADVAAVSSQPEGAPPHRHRSPAQGTAAFAVRAS